MRRHYIYKPLPKSKPARPYIVTGWAVIDSDGSINSGHHVFPNKQEARKWAEGCGNPWFYQQALGLTIRRVKLTVENT